MEQELTNHKNGLSDLREMLLSSGYAERAIDYFLTKPNQGPLEGADQISELTGPCGDTMKCYLKVDQGIIQDARFQVLGCPGAISAAMALADIWSKGKISLWHWKSKTETFLENWSRFPIKNSTASAWRLRPLKRPSGNMKKKRIRRS